MGVLSNRKVHVKAPGEPYEVGGVIYTQSADKEARLVMDCNQSQIPLIFFQDVNGFMVGREAEISGIIKSGAKLVNAVANSVVPKITVIVGGNSPPALKPPTPISWILATRPLGDGWMGSSSRIRLGRP